MAAGLGFKTFVTGEVLTAADTNGYLMQGVNVFANAAARTAAITSPQEGQMSYLKDTNSTEYYSGSAWVTVGGSAPSWTSFTPSRTAITVGNGTEVARYWSSGKLVNVFYQLTFGTTTAITGTPGITTPTTAAQGSFYAGISLFQDTGNAGYAGSTLIAGGIAYGQAFNSAGTYLSASNVSSTVPFTWGNTDVFNLQFTYEEA